MSTPSQIDFFVDRGGTFTDIVYHVHYAGETPPAPTSGVYKLLSRDPDHYPDAPSEGIRRILIQYGLLPKGHTGRIPVAPIRGVRMGTTVATNALLEHNGVKCALLVTKGFQDVLEIGSQARPRIFDLDIVKPHMLYEHVAEVSERLRIVRNGSGAAEDEAGLPKVGSGGGPIKTGPSGLSVEVVSPIDAAEVRSALQTIYNKGIRSVAISFMHAYVYGAHEEEAAAIASSIGFEQISQSHQLMRSIKYVSRTTTTIVDAYLTPLIVEYVRNFSAQFEEDLGDRIYFIQSDGGLTRANQFYGFKAVLSGPAGGVVGCARTACDELGEEVKTVGFDMGGTSTDVCRCDGRKVEHVMEAEIAGVPLQAPQVDVTTVAAGGGSILRWENHMYKVGPESAGAHPGPTCYGNGGPLTVTDANLLLGRLDPRRFPKVFGPTADLPLSPDATRAAFNILAAEINADLNRDPTKPHTPLSVEEIASGFLEIANEAMCRPIRNITEAKGYRCAEHILNVFGGAGGQHGCSIARQLGMSRVYVDARASYLSAVGISMSDVVEERMLPLRRPLYESGQQVVSMLATLTSEAKDALDRQGVTTPGGNLRVEEFISLRYQGTTAALMTRCPAGITSLTHSTEEVIAAYEAAFTKTYTQEFGFRASKDAVILVDEVRVRALVGTIDGESTSSTRAVRAAAVEPYGAASVPSVVADTVPMYMPTTKTYQDIPVYVVAADQTPVSGPAMLIQSGTTIIVEAGCTAFFTSQGNVVLHASGTAPKLTTELHPLPLSLFAHRFMSIAEQMGYTLKRTATSTNIKERLDFSCAIFDKVGNLVANAPHIPVHLGAMGATIRWQTDHYGPNWCEGEVMLSNHPSAGGSHLPDITVMTPCFINGEAVFYVASRGHHADIGGTTPGSMPPFSKTLDEEGAHIKTFKLVDSSGTFQEEGISELLMAPASLGRGISGCRMLGDVIADLRAQVSANHKGVELMKGLVASYGLDVVCAYMGHIQTTAEEATRRALKEVVQTTHASTLRAVDYMDDGTALRLAVTIDGEDGSAVFDWTGTDPQVLGGTNCPRAVVNSAIIYCLRCITKREIPLNQGCLAPVTIITEEGSILDPEEGCGVVAGNVLTSQRVTDVILQALQVAGCSQGCMNNFTMGGPNVAYYETIAGGAGATATMKGADAVQTHMTNTRMTDPEVFEERYPVMIREFSVRGGSGGAGEFAGGNGVTRSILFFAQTMTACISSERRVLNPRGICGGENGERGVNTLFRFKPTKLRPVAGQTFIKQLLWSNDSHTAFNMGGKCEVTVRMGDSVSFCTPGGGGYGGRNAPATVV